ncbi:MAG: sulfur oxidation c-type cytochrome SoxA [Beijerinckiaceae bacterium]|nr:sulfur oxidation c-type cytochrome SoxA [Beijerinckiaceae bacterium]
MRRAGGFVVLGSACLASLASAEIPLDQRKSGADFISAATRAMQEDDTANPAMLSTLDGESMWNEKAGGAQKSCGDCHGPAPKSMKGVAARYPAYNVARQAPVDLSGQINACRTDQQKAEAFKPESAQLLALSAYIGSQSRGLPVSPPDDARLASFRARGEALWSQRIGQLNFSCAQCHDDNWGKRLGSALIPQAHPNAYPIYRLDWQGMGSLQRRFRNCMSGVRAEAYPYGAQEFIDLEVFLAHRARGMPVETPGVRP